MNIKLGDRRSLGPHSRDVNRRGTKYWGRTRPADLTTNSLLQLLLGADVAGVPALLLAAIGGPRVKTGVALAADHLVAVVLLGQDAQGRFDDPAAEAEHQVQCRLCKRRRNLISLLNFFPLLHYVQTSKEWFLICHFF